ncbi:hypothetical protein [Sphingomonas sp. 22176]|uniref:hypothetical protein n=1 Tax=Sphingomonas sp. 22176 TaxID=3453884 RepID=UPI003F83131E
MTFLISAFGETIMPKSSVTKEFILAASAVGIGLSAVGSAGAMPISIDENGRTIVQGKSFDSAIPSGLVDNFQGQQSTHPTTQQNCINSVGCENWPDPPEGNH